jgi:hypothetical protein
LTIDKREWFCCLRIYANLKKAADHCGQNSAAKVCPRLSGAFKPPFMQH